MVHSPVEPGVGLGKEHCGPWNGNAQGLSIIWAWISREGKRAVLRSRRLHVTEHAEQTHVGKFTVVTAGLVVRGVKEEGREGNL